MGLEIIAEKNSLSFFEILELELSISLCKSTLKSGIFFAYLKISEFNFSNSSEILEKESSFLENSNAEMKFSLFFSLIKSNLGKDTNLLYWSVIKI